MNHSDDRSILNTRNSVIVLLVLTLSYIYFPSDSEIESQNLTEKNDMGSSIKEVYKRVGFNRKTASTANFIQRQKKRINSNSNPDHRPVRDYDAPPEGYIKTGSNNENEAWDKEEESARSEADKEDDAVLAQAKKENTLNPDASLGSPPTAKPESKEDQENLYKELPKAQELETQDSLDKIVGSAPVSTSNADSANETDKVDEVIGNTPKVNQAPIMSADTYSISVAEEKTGQIKITAKDPENIFISFSFENLPSFILTKRTDNILTLEINPFYGDNGIYNIRAYSNDDQGAKSFIDLEVIIGKYEHKVKKTQLINSTTNTIIGDLIDGQTIDLDVVGDKLNILAEVPFAESVKFESNDGFTLVEEFAPFSYKGNNSGNFNDWTPVVGPLKITITPYELDAEGGSVGTPYILNLNFIDSNP